MSVPRLLAALLALALVSAQLLWSSHEAEALTHADNDCSLCDLAGGHAPALPAAGGSPPAATRQAPPPALPRGASRTIRTNVLARAPPCVVD
jgi:hypothetical protein